MNDLPYPPYLTYLPVSDVVVFSASARRYTIAKMVPLAFTAAFAA